MPIGRLLVEIEFPLVSGCIVTIGSAMFRFLVGRIGLLIPTFLGVTLVAFSFIRLLPGDPLDLLAGERGIDPARKAELLHQMGFDKPLWEQYFFYLADIFQGDLGTSFVSKKPVLTEFLTLFPATVELSLCAIVIAVALGIPAGIFAAVKRGTFIDQSVMGTALVGYSMPIFWWGLLLIILFSGILQWTPVSGRISLIYYFPPVTGFMLIDSLLSGQKGAFSSARQPFDPAVHRAGDHSARGDCPADALRHA